MSDDLGDDDANTGDTVDSDDDIADSDGGVADSDGGVADPDDAASEEIADDASDQTTQPAFRSSRFEKFANQLDDHTDIDDQPDPGSTQTPVDSDAPAAESDRRQSAADVNSWEWLGGTDESDRNEGGETGRGKSGESSRDKGTDSDTRSSEDSDRARSRVWSSTDTEHANTDDHEQDSHPEQETTDSGESAGQPADESLDGSPSGSTSDPASSPQESHTRESTTDPTADDTTDDVTDFMRGGSATGTGSDDVTELSESPLDPASAAESPGGSEESAAATEDTADTTATADTTVTADTTGTDSTGSTVTDADVPTPEETAAPEEQPKKRRIWSDDGDSSATTPASADGESTTPTNRAGADGDVSEHLSDTSPASKSETPSAVDSGFDSDETTKYHRPDGFSPDLGTSTMVQCGAQDEEKHAACLDLIGVTTDVTPRNVLLVQYREIDQEELMQISEWASQVKVITVGYSQPIPDAVADTVEVIKINNPNAITRLGIVISGTVDNWQSTEYETAVCYDSLNVLLEYTNVQRTFRFLHVLLGSLRKRNTISHFHVDPMAADVQQVNTLTPLFDSILSIDSMGTHLE